MLKCTFGTLKLVDDKSSTKDVKLEEMAQGVYSLAVKRSRVQTPCTHAKAGHDSLSQ